MTDATYEIRIGDLIYFHPDRFAGEDLEEMIDGWGYGPLRIFNITPVLNVYKIVSVEFTINGTVNYGTFHVFDGFGIKKVPANFDARKYLTQEKVDWREGF